MVDPGKPSFLKAPRVILLYSQVLKSTILNVKELGKGCSVRYIKQFLFLIQYYGNQKIEENRGKT